ncbi:MAG: serine incorporator domain-containing protein [Sphingobacteriales bacterium JAD_PAG50586_3]|nr:MAG: serine incorporator domain-containing protein [Sphingobacteriales bacterium JAD_PAG50586_3]
MKNEKLKMENDSVSSAYCFAFSAVINYDNHPGTACHPSLKSRGVQIRETDIISYAKGIPLGHAVGV